MCTVAKAGDDLGGCYLLAVVKTAYFTPTSLTTISLLKTPTFKYSIRSKIFFFYMVVLATVGAAEAHISPLLPAIVTVC
jgi:hypothetical protein